MPRHWCLKRRYLDGKRGIEKPPFRLPDFIAETGITKIRDALLEIENKKNANSRARERMRPKMGKMDIDYQVLISILIHVISFIHKLTRFTPKGTA